MPSHPCKYLYEDLRGPFPAGEYIFTVSDVYSRYPDAVLLKDTSLKCLIKELESIFSRHGYTIEKLQRSKLFLVEMENYLRSKGIHLAKSATYWPRSNRSRTLQLNTAKIDRYDSCRR